MSQAYEKLLRCRELVRTRIDFAPKVALVLGSGLGGYAQKMRVVGELSYNQIPDFPVSTVEGHVGRFLFGYVGDTPVVAMQGRVHYYEGYPMEDVVLPVRLMGLLGARYVFLTNAAGGLDPSFQAGDFMMITDQISDFVPSPLIGPNLDELGPRFCDMSQVYDGQLQELLRKAAKRLGISLKEGVYLQLTGPNFETPAEVRMCRCLGADAVGMSTACEAVAAHHMGMRVCGVSCISNLGCGMTDRPLSHSEVQQTADRVAPLFEKLVTEVIVRIGAL